eukprot:CAMPEP_0117426304 /NCGR_PEP_ID=MMETSP0758-20121206/6461_1 /TAXON_ID=63605 /ORGANISM="Percolomonas cosmopolitus, Strain AE-1 (ATCC 50343)" /LENGTH=665 /DNA_ID=CAMNT_0005211425 /DNA_START=201 /DNA_END=2195 /DNA_ORIENTATION=+
MMKIRKNPIFNVQFNLTKEEQREIAAEQVKILLQSGLLRVEDLHKSTKDFLSRIEQLALFPASAGVKVGVQILLFAGSILNLGTERHNKYLESASKGELPGCFGMTELGHGSNVERLETTAKYDENTQEFVINTPHRSAIKWWLGNAQMQGVICTVFARLIVKGIDHGIHTFLVPIRDPKTMKALPGVTIGDCGDKIGLNGIDNGFLSFKHVRVPRENLLNRFGDVSASGEYISPYKTNGRRFAAHMGELITGRVSIVVSSINIRRLATVITTRYAARRRQFGLSKLEHPILSYRSHQVRLMPILASCYVYEYVKRRIMDLYVAVKQDEEITEVELDDEVDSDDDEEMEYSDSPKVEKPQKEKAPPKAKSTKESSKKQTKTKEELLGELHALSAGMKAIFSWDTQTMIQECRNMCGGHGYSAYNLFGVMKNDHDILQTFEGDNTVLIQQTAAYQLKEFSKQFSSQIQAVYTMVKGGVGKTLSALNPASMLSNPNLCSGKFQLAAFSSRVQHLTQTIAMELRQRKKTYGFFKAWNDVVPMCVNLTRAFVEEQALKEFQKQIRVTKNREIRHILKLMRNVWALNIIQQDWIHFDNLISVNINQMRLLFEKLCERMSNHAVSLVDAFGLSDEFIQAPIGLAKGDYMNHILNTAIDLNRGNHQNIEDLP